MGSHFVVPTGPERLASWSDGYARRDVPVDAFGHAAAVPIAATSCVDRVEPPIPTTRPVAALVMNTSYRRDPNTTRHRGRRVIAAGVAVATLGLASTGLASAQGDGTNSVERIVFAPGADRASFRDYNPGGTNRYLVRAAAGQTMTVQISAYDGNPTFDVYAPDGSALATDQTTTTVDLPVDGDYVVDVQISGDDSDFVLATTIPAGGADDGDDGNPGGVNSVERIVFDPGASKATFRDYNPGGTNRYLVHGGPNQSMTVQIAPEDGSPTFSILSPDGSPLATGETNTTVSLPTEGDYIVDVTIEGDDSDFWLATWIA